MTYKDQPRAESVTKEGHFAREIMHILGKNIEEIKVCEFGAWDGIHKSNIRHFALEECSLAIFIEASKKKFRQLKNNYSDKDNVMLLNEFVQTSGPSSLDSLLQNIACPHIDFLSIDIDGNDYHIVESIKSTSVDMICIEFNPTIPFDNIYVQSDDFETGHGSSLAAIRELGKRKGYVLLTVIGANALLIRKELLTKEIEQFASQKYPIPSGPAPIYLYVGFDGELFSNRKTVYLNWHKIHAPIKNMSPVPKHFRSIPENMTITKKVFFYIWLSYQRPKKFTFLNIKNAIMSLLK